MLNQLRSAWRGSRTTVLTGQSVNLFFETTVIIIEQTLARLPEKHSVR